MSIRTGAGAAWWPCLIREDIVCDEVDGKVFTYCSRNAPGRTRSPSRPSTRGVDAGHGRFSGRREWEDAPHHGWDLADAIKDLGFVRSDGKTLVPQPHLRFEQKECGRSIRARLHARKPLRTLRA